jgi:hypothetical protein
LHDAGADDLQHFSYVRYRDGKGTDNIGVAVAEPGREGFFKYMGENDVWHVELGGVGFSQNNAVWSPEKHSEEQLRRLRKFDYSKSDKVVLSTRIHPNGHKEYIREWPSTGHKSTSIYDPKFNLPIEQIAISQIFGVREVIVHNKVEFEDIDGFARCKSFVSDRLDFPDKVRTEVHTTIEYQWLQFNADDLKWPDEQKIIASDESMKAYLLNQQPSSL